MAKTINLTENTEMSSMSNERVFNRINEENKRMEICKYLESRMIREIDAMPYNLTERKMNKLVAKAVKKVGSEVAKKFGVECPNLQALVDMFFYCGGFPNFPNEPYIELLKGKEYEISKIGEVNVDGEDVSFN